MRTPSLLASALAVASAAASGLRASAEAELTFYGAPRLGGSCSGTTFDFYELVTQWAITECSDGTFSCTADWTFFTLHGLWPQDNNGNYPCNCGTAPFDPSVLAPIQDDMNTYWPSLNGASSTFWDHEWSKHGTCASTFKSQFAFFNGTLSLLHKYDIVKALGAAGITPSNTAGFTKSQFGQAMEAAYGATGILTCDSSGYISGVTLCVSKAGAIMKCPSNVTPQCSATTIYLPSKMF